MLRRLVLIVVACGLAVAATGCNGGSDDDVPESIVRTETQLISAREVADTRSGSPERAFLRFWSNLQYESWLVAISFFRPPLVDAIGDDRLIGTLSVHREYFRLTKPVFRGRVRAGRDYVTRYLAPVSVGGPPVPLSITWRRDGRTWRIHHVPQLDEMLRVFEQVRVQADIDPLAGRPSRRALRAGTVASLLQARFLAAERRRERTRARPGVP